jgi:hypothetical protein
MRREEIGGDSEAFGITRYRVEQEGRRLLGHRLPLGDKANLCLPVSSFNSLEISLPFGVPQEVSQVEPHGQARGACQRARGAES